MPEQWRRSSPLQLTSLSLPNPTHISPHPQNPDGFMTLLSGSDRVLGWCKNIEKGDSEVGLEGKIVEFMNGSKKPDKFPTRKELIEAGRLDLVEGIVKRELEKCGLSGGEGRQGGGGGVGRGFEVLGLRIRRMRMRMIDHCGQIVFHKKKELIEAGRKDLVDEIVKRGGWMTLGWDEDYAKGSAEGVFANDGNNMPPGHVLPSEEKSWAFENGGVSSSSPNNSLTAGIVEEPFTAGDSPTAVYSSDGSFILLMFLMNQIGFFFGKRRSVDSSKQKLETSKDVNESLQEFDACTQIRTRLQNLEGELSSALCLLRPNPDDVPEKDQGQSCDELNKLSDAWEFKENEIMRAKDKLRSIRVNVAVVEEKMTLAINDAQRVVDDKQRRINDAYGSATSSYRLCKKDGKVGQGVFSLTLKLYPGKYEARFALTQRPVHLACSPVVVPSPSRAAAASSPAAAQPSPRCGRLSVNTAVEIFWTIAVLSLVAAAFHFVVAWLRRFVERSYAMVAQGQWSWFAAVAAFILSIACWIDGQCVLGFGIGLWCCLRNSIENTILEKTVENEDLFVATVKLMTAAAHFQPAFLSATFTGAATTELQMNASNTKDHTGEISFWPLTSKNASILIDMQASQYADLLKAITSSRKFGENLSGCILSISGMKIPSPSNLSEAVARSIACNYRCQSTAFDIFSLAMFLRKKLLHAEVLTKQASQSSSGSIGDSIDSQKLESLN
ncbi:PTST homolog 2, chloroplastic-like protein, partial [Drosera capensis]